MSLRFLIFYKSRAGAVCFRILSEAELTRESTEFKILEGDVNIAEINASAKTMGICPVPVKEGSHLSVNQSGAGKIYLSQTERDTWRVFRTMSTDPKAIRVFYTELLTTVPGSREAPKPMKFDAAIIPENLIIGIAGEHDRSNNRRPTWTVDSIRKRINLIMDKYGDRIRSLKQGDNIEDVYLHICDDNPVAYHQDDKNYELRLALLIMQGVFISEDLANSNAHDDVLVHSEHVNYWDVQDDALKNLGDTMQKSFASAGVRVKPWTVADVRKEMEYCFLTYRDFIFDNVKKGVGSDTTFHQIMHRESSIRNRNPVANIPFAIAISRLGEYAHPRR